MNGVQAFREAFAVSEPLDSATFISYAARQMRYRIFWSYFENDAYSKVHKWAESLKEQYGLYEYIRNIYNPAFRMASFWQTHLMGGALDGAAGDGSQEPSALPIHTDNEALRPAIAALWKASNWGVSKNIFTLYGTVMGDVGLRVIDDVARGRVYLSVVNAGTLADVTLDPFGNVKGYIIEEVRLDPRPTPQQRAINFSGTVLYKEIVTRDGDNVSYQTFLDGAPYAWPEHINLDGNAMAEWSEPYGFVPMVLAQHINVGLDWGWSELQPTQSKIREVDDLASKLDDQIRKTVDAKWAFIGVRKPNEPPAVAGRRKTTNDPEPGRDEEGALYLPEGGDVKPMVAPLSIADTSAHIASVLAAIEQDHPELNKALYEMQGTDMSGRAIRLVRQPVEEKCQDYRAHYDDPLVRAQQMAISIGGFRGYPDYTGFNLDSYAAGKLAHTIGKRPVFASDPLDTLEFKQAFYTAAGTAVAANVPIEVALRDLGWNDQQIKEYLAAKQREQQAQPPAPREVIPTVAQ